MTKQRAEAAAVAAAAQKKKEERIKANVKKLLENAFKSKLITREQVEEFIQQVEEGIIGKEEVIL